MQTQETVECDECGEDFDIGAEGANIVMCPCGDYEGLCPECVSYLSLTPTQ